MTSPQFSERSSSMVEMESGVPPGFRFHPTEEELVGYYLKRKINSLKINLDVIVELDLYKMEPWDIQDKCKLGYEEQKEWYFFSHKDKKYPTGTRTNRATAAGFWKATGRDKAVMSNDRIIGMRKTLVFYQGRAPNGRKSDWIMHEYRLQTSHHAPPQEEGWVVCRAFRKPSPSHVRQLGFEAECYLREQIRLSRPNNFSSPSSSSFGDHHHNILNHHHQTHHHHLLPNNNNNNYQPLLISSSDNHHHPQHHQLVEVLPNLDSPTSLGGRMRSSSEILAEDHQGASQNMNDLIIMNNNVNGFSSSNNNNNNEEYYSDDHVESLDSFFASNLTPSDHTTAAASAFFANSSSNMHMNMMMVMPHFHHHPDELVQVQPQNQANSHVL